MDEKELDMLASQSTYNAPVISPPPAPAATRTLGNVQELIETMRAIDAARMQFFEAEQKKMMLLEDNIARRLEEKFESRFSTSTVAENTGMDPIIIEGAKILLSAWMQNTPQNTKTLPPTPPPKTEILQSVKEELPKTEEQQKTEGPPMQTYTQEQIYAIADKIYEHYPKDVRAFKLGLVSRDDAIKKIMVAGLSADDAGRVADALNDTEYEEGTP